MKSYYDYLGLNHGANKDEIKQAFRLFKLRWHKNIKHNSEGILHYIKVDNAYSLLINDESRVLHNTNYDHFSKIDFQDGLLSKNAIFDAINSSLIFSNNLPKSRDDTNEIKLKIDFTGNEIDEDVDFFKYPNNIGQIQNSYSDFYKNSKPATEKEKTKHFVITILISILVLGLILYFGNPNTTWSIIWAILTLGLGLLIGLTDSFLYFNKYVGEKGFAEFSCSKSIDNIENSIEHNFNDFTDLFFIETHCFKNGFYSETTFHFGIVGLNKGKSIYSNDGSYQRKTSLEEQPLTLNFYRKIEQFWTIHLVRDMMNKLHTDGFILFIIGSNNKYDHEQYVKLKLGELLIMRADGKEINYKIQDIKKVYFEENELCIQHNNFEKKFFKNSGNEDKIPLLNLSNRLFFNIAFRQLIGYKID